MKKTKLRVANFVDYGLDRKIEYDQLQGYVFEFDNQKFFACKKNSKWNVREFVTGLPIGIVGKNTRKEAIESGKELLKIMSDSTQECIDHFVNKWGVTNA